MSDAPLRQEVNLLDQGFRPQAVPLSAQFILTLCAMLIVGLAVFYGYARLQLPALHQQATRLDDRVAADHRRLEAISADGAQKALLAQLDGEIQQLDTDRKAKRTVVDTLSQRRLGNTTGFSPYLEGLAKQIQDGLWLRKIDIGDGGGKVSLSGTTVDPKLVPAYLQRLSRESAFSGTDFSSFEMHRQKKQPSRVDFILKTVADKGAGKG